MKGKTFSMTFCLGQQLSGARGITPEVVFGYDKEAGYMTLLAIVQWVEVKDVVDKIDFEPMFTPELARMELPTEDKLKVLRVYLYLRGGAIYTSNWIEL